MQREEKERRVDKLARVRDCLTTARNGLGAYEDAFGQDGLVHSLRELLRSAHQTVLTSIDILEGVWVDGNAGVDEEQQEQPDDLRRW